MHRLDATSTEMRRVMTFDEDSEDEGADRWDFIYALVYFSIQPDISIYSCDMPFCRIIKAASTRLQLGSSVKRAVRGGGKSKIFSSETRTTHEYENIYPLTQLVPMCAPRMFSCEHIWSCNFVHVLKHTICFCGNVYWYVSIYVGETKSVPPS